MNAYGLFKMFHVTIANQMEQVYTRQLHEYQVGDSVDTVRAEFCSDTPFAASSSRKIKCIIAPIDRVTVTCVEIESFIEYQAPFPVLPLSFNERHCELQHAYMVLPGFPLQDDYFPAMVPVQWPEPLEWTIGPYVRSDRVWYSRAGCPIAVEFFGRSPLFRKPWVPLFLGTVSRFRIENQLSTTRSDILYCPGFPFLQGTFARARSAERAYTLARFRCQIS